MCSFEMTQRDWLDHSYLRHNIISLIFTTLHVFDGIPVPASGNSQPQSNHLLERNSCPLVRVITLSINCQNANQIEELEVGPPIRVKISDIISLVTKYYDLLLSINDDVDLKYALSGDEPSNNRKLKDHVMRKIMS